jgi:hypothetical protein
LIYAGGAARGELQKHDIPASELDEAADLPPDGPASTRAAPRCFPIRTELTTTVKVRANASREAMEVRAGPAGAAD